MEIKQSSRFKKDIKRFRHLPKQRETLERVVATLARGETPDAKYHDHLLVGNWKGHRECHIAPDVLLIYRVYENTLELLRFGSHSELFE